MKRKIELSSYNIGDNTVSSNKQLPKKAPKKYSASSQKSQTNNDTISIRKCGLCGKSSKIMKLKCCKNWICYDYDNLASNSFSSNSCIRNHNRFTLCAYHFLQKHEGLWYECDECKNNMETELYVWYGTNEFNFEKLQKIPDFKPKYCKNCYRIIKLGKEPYSVSKNDYVCFHCLVLNDDF